MECQHLIGNEFELLQTGDTFEIRGAETLSIDQAILLFRKKRDLNETVVVKNPKSRTNHYIIYADNHSPQILSQFLPVMSGES